MIPAGQLAGAVLAGGKSTRMGRNKALLRVDGQPLWQRQLKVLRAAGAKPVFVVQAPGQRALQPKVLRDTVHGAGPLAGLHAALATCEHPWLAVLAVDMPAVDAEWFEQLARHCRSSCGAVIRTSKGYEPLAAIYPQAAVDEASARLARGEFALHEFVRALVQRRQLKVVRLPQREAWRATNWNSPEDMPSLWR